MVSILNVEREVNMLIHEKTGSATKLQAGDIVDWRLKNGTIGFNRGHMRLIDAITRDDRFAVTEEGIGINAATRISILLASTIGCIVKALRKDEDIVIFEFVETSSKKQRDPVPFVLEVKNSSSLN